MVLLDATIVVHDQYVSLLFISRNNRDLNLLTDFLDWVEIESEP